MALGGGVQQGVARWSDTRYEGSSCGRQAAGAIGAAGWLSAPHGPLSPSKSGKRYPAAGLVSRTSTGICRLVRFW